jgi:hypothetical protein
LTQREKPFEGASNAPIAADFSSIPLPPEGTEGEATAKVAEPVAAAEDVALIEFLNPAAMRKRVPFAHPFRVDGMTFADAVVHRLTYAQVLRVQQTAPKDADGNVDLLEFYAVMAAIPAAVIRAMEAGDSKRLREACYDFLPLDEEASASS